MSTTTLVEQRLPIAIQLLSRISTYAHFIESIMAIIVFWSCPSLAPTAPLLRQTLTIHDDFTHAISIHSLKSTTSTLVDGSSRNRDESDSTPADMDNEGKLVDSAVKSYKLNNPLSKLSCPVMKSHSLSLMPFARRMSLPAKRFSESISHAVSTPFQSPTSSPFQSPLNSPAQTPLSTPIGSSCQTPASELETCYFSLSHSPVAPVFDMDPSFEVEEAVLEGGATELIYGERSETFTCSNIPEVAKPTRFKRVAIKTKHFLRLRRRV